MVYRGGIIIKSAFWIALIVILSSISCACMDQSRTGVEGLQDSIKVVDRTPREGIPHYTLNEALEGIGWYCQENGIDPANLIVYYIHGFSVDREGRAESWLLGIESEGESYVFTFEDGEWTHQRWSESLEGETIRIGEIIAPDSIYEFKRAEIENMTIEMRVNTTELDIVGGRVTITARSGDRQRQLVIDAYTVEAIV